MYQARTHPIRRKARLPTSAVTVTPTAHWLEYTSWANPIIAEPMVVTDGHAIIPDRPGVGLGWDEAAVATYQVEV